MTRLLLIDTWRPGAVQVCVGQIRHMEITAGYTPIMRWAVLQERNGNIITDANGHVVDIEWRDVTVEE